MEKTAAATEFAREKIAEIEQEQAAAESISPDELALVQASAQEVELMQRAAQIALDMQIKHLSKKYRLTNVDKVDVQTGKITRGNHSNSIPQA
jgi:hypothetical protein